MNLDQLAQNATQELIAIGEPDASARLADLKRMRTRRRFERSAALVAVLALIGGGWVLSSRGQQASAPIQPAHPSTVVENGVLAVVNSDSVVTLDGDLGFVPQDVARFSPLAFTPDGTELVYQNRQNMVAAANVDTGETRIIGPCPPQLCDAALSPDGQRLASHGRVHGDSGLVIRTVGSNERTFLPTPGVEAYFPVWSPDGQTLAFIAAQGLYTIAADGTGLRQLHRITDPYHLSSSRLAWSPDGQVLAFLDSAVYEPASGTSGDTQPLTFSLTTIRADGTQPQVLRDLGRCVCVGISPPALTWSPDGTLIAVSSIRNGRDAYDARTGPLYLLRPDGSVEDTIGGGGSIHSITWQPLPK